MADTAPMGKDEAIDLLRDALEHYQRLAPDTITAREALRMTAHLALSTAPEPAALVRQFLRAAYPCCTSIDPRGFQWCEAWLDEARAAVLASRPAEVDERLKVVHAAGAQLADAQQRRAERCERLGIAEVDDEGLPALPVPHTKVIDHSMAGWREIYQELFTAEQYRQGQRDAVAADRARRGGQS